MTAIVIATAILHGRTGPAVIAIVLVAAQALPEWVVLLALIAWSLRHRPASDAEIVFLSAVASHLRAGAPLRHALIAATWSCPDLPLAPLRRALHAGVTLEGCAPHLDEALPTQGRAAAHALRVAADTGGRIAPMFDRITERAAAALDLRRETRSATAAARASALLLAGGPMAIALHRLLTRDLEGLHGALAVAGSSLLVLGGFASLAMARRVSR